MIDDGFVWIWGTGESGQLGLKGSTGSISQPEKLDGEASSSYDFMKISCGEAHTAAIVRLRTIDPSHTSDMAASSQLPHQATVGGPPTDKESPKTSGDNISSMKSQQNDTTTTTTDISAIQTDGAYMTNINQKSENSTLSSTSNSNGSSTTTAVLSETDNSTKKLLEDGNKAGSNNNKLRTASELETETNVFLTRNTTTVVNTKVSGFLNKKGEIGIVKRWKKRFFQVEGDEIQYFEREGEECKGSIKMNEIIDVLPGQVRYGFNIVTTKKRVYELHAFSKEEMDMWVQALKALTAKSSVIKK